MLTAIVSLWLSFSSAAQWSLGAGSETRLQQEINSQAVESKSMPQFFIQYRLGPWGFGIELGREELDTASGGLSVSTKTWSSGFWARREFLQPLEFSPFVGAGAGLYFDEVTSRFGAAEDVRSGQRMFAGLGGGLSHALWEHLLVEAEARVLAIQDRKEVAFSGIIRIGYVN